MQRMAAPFMALACLWLSATIAHAQVSPESEYKRHLRVSEDIAPLGENAFGEKISLYNGSLSFEQVDIDAPGTGLPIQLIRTLRQPDTLLHYAYVNNEAVDWQVQIPRIDTITAENYGWDFNNGAGRCSQISRGPDYFKPGQRPGDDGWDFYSSDWWHGYQLRIPGVESQDVLRRDPSNTLSPVMAGPDGVPMIFPSVTKQHWAIGCLAKTANGQPGEGFLAVSPSGVRYYFDWLVYRELPRQFGRVGNALRRQAASMLVSRVEDRFGNSLAYRYDGQGNLTVIEASDGRQLALTYEAWQYPLPAMTGFRLTSATLQPASDAPRTWKYGYASDPANPRLNSVQLPDGSEWAFPDA